MNGTTELNDNMVLWNRFFHTPPSRTKAFKRAGGFSGTAIQPYYCIERATEEWGPHGKGWGHSEIDNKMHVHVDGQAIWMSKIVVWWREGDQTYQTGPQWGQTMMVVKRASGEMFIDEEAPKKAVTDGMMKCLSYLGLGGDVHMGMFDDSKYVSEARIEERKEREAAEAEKRKEKKKAPAKKAEDEPGEEEETPGEDESQRPPEQEAAEAPKNGKGNGNGFDPFSWRDRVCADVKLLKTEKAVRNFWATTVKPTLETMINSEDAERKKIAVYVHNTIKSRLTQVKADAKE